MCSCLEVVLFPRSLATTGAEAEWLRDFLFVLPVVENPIPAISMNCDNQTMITKVNSSRNNMKSTSERSLFGFGN